MKLPVIISLMALTSIGAVSAANDVFQTAKPYATAGSHKINPRFAQKRTVKFAAPEAETKSSLPQGYTLYEDFEEWDGTVEWQPEGWTFDHKKVEDGHPLWRAYGYDPLDPVNYPSTSYVFFHFTQPVDEWLISPEFSVEKGMWFTADCFNTGTYYFDIDADMFTGKINSIKKVNDFIIHISTDNGATWKPLYSIPDEMMKENYTFAYEYWDRHGWETIQLDLADYAGQTAKIAFQIVGDKPSDSESSDASGIDNVTVGLPTPEVSYGRPESALFFGLTDTDIFVPATFMVVPVHRPVTFTNNSATPGAVYSWTVDHTDGEYVDDNQKELTVTYGTNHKTEKDSRNNIYNMPVLTATGDYFAEKSYSMPGFLQAGGRGEYEIQYYDETTGERDAEWLQLGLSVVDPQTEGTRTYADVILPYFGYNLESDRYWTCRTFGLTVNEYEQQGYRDSKTDWSQLTHYANFFYTSDQPLVIEGIRTNAYGRGYGYNGTMPGAKFTAEIYYLDEDFTIPEKPNYSVDLAGKDVTVIDRNASNHILTLNFKLDEPVVVSKKDCPAFVVAITGFRDPENIEYFSPEMSANDNPDGLALGWTGKLTRWGDYQLPLSWGPVLYHTEETELPGQQLISFYIMLDGAYTWLEGEDEVTVQANEEVTVTLDSYYDAKELKVEGLPEWLSLVSSEGKWGETRFTFKSTSAADATAKVTFKAPGVEKVLTVNNGKGAQDGIDEIAADGSVRYYNPQGIEVRKPSTGIYFKVSGNKVTKIFHK